MRDLRLKMMPWLALNAALVAVQYLVITSGAVWGLLDGPARGLMDVIGSAGGFSPAAGELEAAVSSTTSLLIFVLVMAVQALKMVPAAARLHDLGRPKDEAVFTLVPLVNLGLFWQLCASTPIESVRTKRIEGWMPELQAIGALRAAASLFKNPMFLALALGTALGTALLQATLAVWSGELGQTIANTPLPIRQGWAQMGWVVCGMLLLYTIVQFPKRARASRASWVPSLFLLPAIFLTLSVWVDPKNVPPTILLGMGLGMALTLMVRPLLVSLWNISANELREGRSLNLGEVVSRSTKGWATVAGPHGAAAIAVLIGMQVVLPGVHYALQFAFVNQAVLFEPDKPSLQRSGTLTRGIRRKLGAVLLVWLYLWIIPGAVAMFVAEGPSGITQFFLALLGVVPQDQLPSGVLLVWDMAGMLAAVLTEVAMMFLYFSRRERLEDTSDDATEEVSKKMDWANEPTELYDPKRRSS